MKKKVSIILLVLGIILLFVGAFFLINKEEKKPIEKPTPPSTEKPGKTEEEKTEEVVKNEIDTFVETLFKEDVTKEEIEKLVNSPVDVTYIFYGKDSYMRTGFTFGLKGLDDYDKKLDELADKLDAKVKANFEFELTEYVVSAEGDVVQRNKFKSYYYVQFVNDYMALRNELLAYTDIDLSELANREMTTAEKEKMYKINVKTFELMSYHFDDYINKNEYSSYETIYQQNNNSIQNNLYSLLIHLSGNFYENVNYDTPEKQTQLENERKTRVKNILNQATLSGRLDTSNPYKLK